MLLSFFDFAKLEASSHFISIYDKQLNFTFINTACAKRYDLDKEKVVGQPLFAVFPSTTENDYRVKCLRLALSENRSFYFSDLPYLYSEGHFSNVILPVRDDKNTITSVMMIAGDQRKEDTIISRKEFIDPLLKKEVVSARLNQLY